MVEGASWTPSRFSRIAALWMAFLLLALLVGVTFYAQAVYLERLTATGRFSVTDVSLGATITSLAGGLSGLGVARLLRRTSIKVLLVAGGLGTAVSLSCVGAAQTPWQLWASYLALGATGALAGGITLTELLARVFQPDPTFAITIGSSGMSIGGAFLPPVVGIVLDGLGIFVGSVAIGAAILGLTVLAALLIDEPPRPEAEAAGHRASGHGAGYLAQAGAWFRRVRPNRVVLLLMAGFGLLIFSQNGTMIHILQLASDRDIPRADLALTVIAGTSFVFRFVGMAVLAFVGIRWFALAVALCQGVGQVVLSGASGTTELLLGATLLGLTIGNITVLSSLFVLHGFSLARYAGVYAIVSLAGTLGGALGPLMLALGAEALGSYTVPLLLLGVSAASGGLALAASGINSAPTRPRRRRRGR